MRRDLLSWAVLAVAVAVAGYVIYTTYLENRPCAAPVAYSVGAVDPRFEVSKEVLTTRAKAAAAIWNKAAGKELFTYDPAAELELNLIYDEREANTKLGARISAQQAEQESARAALEALQDRFTAGQAAYNKKVEEINARGGATKSEAAKLAAERQVLQDLADTVNAGADRYNASVAALNALIAEFNKTAGRTFEQGQYVRDAAGERINIFQFVNATQLTRVLAHEFGHSLGLDHNDDPKAIMYAQNESGNLVPTAADLAALKGVCGGVKLKWNW